MVQFPPAPPEHHNKENTEAGEVTVPVVLDRNAKKRKANTKPMNPRQKHSKVMEDNLMVADTHSGQKKDAEDNSTAETASTCSDHRSNLSSCFKEAEYAPPKRNPHKKDS